MPQRSSSACATQLIAESVGWREQRVNWEAIGALGEWAGALAVIATLVYLAIQVRQNSAGIQATAELEASGRLAQFVTRISTDQNMRRIWEDVSDGKELPEEDSRDYVWLMAEFFHMSEGIYIQYSRGFLSDEIWGEYERLMVGYLQFSVARSWWRNGNGPYSDVFREHVETLLAQDPQWIMRSARSALD